MNILNYTLKCEIAGQSSLPHATRLNLPRLPLIDVSNVFVCVGPRRVKHAISVGSLVRVPPEEIALGLGEVGGEGGATVGVEVVERPRQGGGGDAVADRHDDHAPPGGRPLVELARHDGI